MRPVFTLFISFALLFLCLSLNAQMQIGSDGTWKASSTLQAGWETVGFNDAAWGNSFAPASVGTPGVAPLPGTQRMWVNGTPANAYFRKTFTLNTAVTAATAQAACDNEFRLYVNGNYVGGSSNLNAHASYNIQPFLQCGTNVIAIHGIEYVPGTPSWVNFLASIDTLASLPAITPINNGPVCETEALNLAVNTVPGASYSWTGPNGFTSTQQDPVISNATVAATGTYTVDVSIGNCPIGTGTTNATVDACGTHTAGVINTYTPVTALNICTNTLTVGSSVGFNVGDTVLVIQMKGAEIDQSQTAAFGNVTNYADAGNYEFTRIAAINGNDITLVYSLSRSYTLTGAVQLVSVPQYTNMYINGSITAQPWNGSTGGIVVFEASGTVTMNADIVVSGQGFEGGQLINFNGSICDEQRYAANQNSEVGGRKGEGIANFIPGMEFGRGKQANGGGGGNAHNAGGAGGSNMGVGGRGGDQWVGCSNIPTGGDPGATLTYNTTLNKTFMGGGGGGGNQNNAAGSSGANGGGMVIIRANAITSNGAAIIAEGADQTVLAGNDGAGGGGAGGTVLLEVPTITGNLTVDLDGGDGGSVNWNASPGSYWGPGGGGGGGALWVSGGAVPGAITLSAAGGANGGFLCCGNAPHGSQPGQPGGSATGLLLAESVDSFMTIPDTYVDTAICASDSIFLANAWQNTAGLYIDTFQTALGCDSIVETTLSINPVYDIIIDTTICQGNFVIVNGIQRGTSGTYIEQLTTQAGCDSIITVNLTVNPVHFPIVDTAICDGESVWAGGALQTTAGTYIDSLQNQFGCDSVVTTRLTVYSSPYIIIDTAICNGESLLAGGALQTTAGTYIDSLMTPFGCDSVIETRLTIYPTPVDTQDVAICSDESVFLQGDFQNTSGTYTDVFTSALGCDSTVITNLTVYPAFPLVLSPAVDSINPKDSMQLLATPGADSYAWSPSDYLSCDDCPDPFVQPEETLEYTLTVTDSNYCQYEATSLIILLQPTPDVFVPNAFSPNGDGLNDSLYVYTEVPFNNMLFQVFDRWGEMVFETNNWDEGWDGFFQGKEQVPGVYVYRLSVVHYNRTTERKQGSVLLLR